MSDSEHSDIDHIVIRHAEFHVMVDGNYFFGQSWKKLKPAERQICLDFIARNWEWSISYREQLICRMWIDKADKPKGWALITELLMNFHSRTVWRAVGGAAGMAPIVKLEGGADES